jgi:cytochrome c oxidase assembly factor CtaG
VLLIAHVASPPGSEWTPDIPLLAALALAGCAWIWLVRVVDRAHPATPVAGWRVVSFLGGLVAIGVALGSPVDTFADDLFSVHMVQHLLLGFEAAPLLVLGSPMLVVLRAAPGRIRRGAFMPLLGSRFARVITHPAVTWIAFGTAMWIAHFSPLFAWALASEPVHWFEHLLLLGTGYLYWLTAIGSEPIPYRLSWSGRFLYLFIGMPVSSVLGLAIVSQTGVLYVAYVRDSVAAALADQRLAGTLMWVGADLISVVLIGLLVWMWVSAESPRARRRNPAPPAGGRVDVSAH